MPKRCNHEIQDLLEGLHLNQSLVFKDFLKSNYISLPTFEFLPMSNERP